MSVGLPNFVLSRSLEDRVGYQMSLVPPHDDTLPSNWCTVKTSSSSFS